MLPYIYLHIKKSFYWLFSLVGILALTSCGGYQNAGYATDDIYGNSDRQPAEKNQPADNIAKNESGYYQNYFGEQNEKIVEARNYLEDEDVFTDVDSYSSNAPDGDGSQQQEIYREEEQTYQGNQPAWGSNPTSVSVNIYNTGGFYNPYMYNYGWGGPYFGYGYGGYPYYANNWYIGFSPWRGYYRPWGYGGYGNYYNPYYYGNNYYRNRYQNVAYHRGSRNYRNNSNYRSNRNNRNTKSYGRSSSDYKRKSRVNNPNRVNARSNSSYKRRSVQRNQTTRSSSNRSRNSYQSNSSRRSSNNNSYRSSNSRNTRSNSARSSSPTRSSGSYGRSSSGSSSRSSGGGTRSSGRRR